MNSLDGLTLPQLQERELHLLLEWERLVEHGLKILNADQPDALHALAADKSRLLGQWRDLRIAASAPGANAAAAHRDDWLQHKLRITAERTMALNHRYETALRARELFVVTRLQALCCAAGKFGVYSGAGQVDAVPTSRKNAYLA